MGMTNAPENIDITKLIFSSTQLFGGRNKLEGWKILKKLIIEGLE